jgi:hypothetical protein
MKLIKKIYENITRGLNKIFKKNALRQRYIKEGRYKELPSSMTYSQLKLIEIFKDMLYNKKSKLTYNKRTNAACISYKEENQLIYFMFIEEDSVKIIDTVQTDISINPEIYAHLMWLFYNKQNIDFTQFVNESNQKFNHAMDIIHERVRELRNKK